MTRDVNGDGYIDDLDRVLSGEPLTGERTRALPGTGEAPPPVRKGVHRTGGRTAAKPVSVPPGGPVRKGVMDRGGPVVKPVGGPAPGGRVPKGKPKDWAGREHPKDPKLITEWGTDYGNTLADVLHLPAPQRTELFTMQIFEDGGPKRPAIFQYSIAAGLEWLRNLAATDREAYNAFVASLYQAGYLSASQVRLNSYTSEVAAQFVKAATDVAAINWRQNAEGHHDPMGLLTLQEHLDLLAAGATDSGFGVDGSGSGGGGGAPARVDHVEDELTLRRAIRDAAQSSLGRSLSDEEQAHIMGQFRSIEGHWNDRIAAAEINPAKAAAIQSAADPRAAAIIAEQYPAGPITVPDRPNTAVVADELVRDQHAQERAGEDLGSYVGVMRQMMGLTGGGMSGLAQG